MSIAKPIPLPKKKDPDHISGRMIHLRYGVIVTNYKAFRFIIALQNISAKPIVFVREYVSEDQDPYDYGDYYALYKKALSSSQAEEILSFLKEDNMRKARTLLKRYFQDASPICEGVGPIVLDDMVPDEWYDSWKRMEAIITISGHHPGYYEETYQEEVF